MIQANQFGNVTIKEADQGKQILINAFSSGDIQVFQKANLIKVDSPQEVYDSEQSIYTIDSSVSAEGATGAAIVIASCGQVDYSSINIHFGFVDKSGIVVVDKTINDAFTSSDDIYNAPLMVDSFDGSKIYDHFGYCYYNSFVPINNIWVSVMYIRQAPSDTSMTTIANVYALYSDVSGEVEGKLPIIQEPPPAG